MREEGQDAVHPGCGVGRSKEVEADSGVEGGRFLQDQLCPGEPVLGEGRFLGQVRVAEATSVEAKVPVAAWVRGVAVLAAAGRGLYRVRDFAAALCAGEG